MSDAAGWRPLADRMRPATEQEVAGQRHLLGPGKPLSGLLAANPLHSAILWGPPGTGKTTLATAGGPGRRRPVYRAVCRNVRREGYSAGC